jgi:hypothetical protein
LNQKKASSITDMTTWIILLLLVARKALLYIIFNNFIVVTSSTANVDSEICSGKAAIVLLSHGKYVPATITMTSFFGNHLKRPTLKGGSLTDYSMNYSKAVAQ